MVFSLALVRDGEPILGVVYQPFLDELYVGKVGLGATRNDEQISVSGTSSIDHKTLITSPAHRVHALFDLDGLLAELSARGARVYNYGSVTYNAVLVAAGNSDIAFFPWKNSWDVAAAKVIIEEAGGTTSDPQGDKQRYDQDTAGFIATNGVLHDEIVKILQRIS